MEYKTSLSQREASKRWRDAESNKEHYLRLCRVNNKKYQSTSESFKEKNRIKGRLYYEENKESILAQKKINYQKKKELKKQTEESKNQLTE